jgi:ribulose-5-phosphate 4-epimerase/fuculose-1-phosphate aldolase
VIALLKKYERKLVEQGICDSGAPLIGGIDAETVWNRDGEEIPALRDVIARLNINSILFARPSEPYFSILNALAEHGLGPDGAIHPQDTESRTFLHDIPVVEEFDPEAVAGALRRRKSVVVRDRGIVTYGIVSPEQAFVTYSSVCFASYVKLFGDFIARRNLPARASRDYGDIMQRALPLYGNFIDGFSDTPRIAGPFGGQEQAIAAMCEAGLLTVRSRMVDSFFGNISCRMPGGLLISQTGSSLDELAGLIDLCPEDNSSTAGITASSELTAHRGVYAGTDRGTILHGHPKFSVIMSMLCDDDSCGKRGRCHVLCDKKRSIRDVPVVPGEVGTGPTGLCNTLPPALTGRGAIVWGHGLFTTGVVDFTDAFENLVEIEKMCYFEYLNLIN